MPLRLVIAEDNAPLRQGLAVTTDHSPTWVASH